MCDIECNYHCSNAWSRLLNKIFLQASTKNWAFLEKINDLLFFHFDNCESLERGHGANVSNAFLLNTNLLGSSAFF